MIRTVSEEKHTGMRILHISDTHGLHGQLVLPEADVIVHSGDFTFGGSIGETRHFLKWFCGLPYEHKIFIAGNHDMCLYGIENMGKLPGNVHYLCNSGVEIDGIRFYGVPMFMEHVMDGTMDRMINAIPMDTDVLVTHQPPRGYCDTWHDRHCGDRLLRQKVDSIPGLKLHLFGHQHGANGEATDGGKLFCNSAVLDSHYNMVADGHVVTIHPQ